MKVFADANILVSVVNKEYPIFPYTSRILSLNGTLDFTIVTSPVCLAIAFYFAGKKSSAADARTKLRTLSNRMDITGITADTVRTAFTDPSVLDLDDGLEYYSALQAGCNCIVTENKDDFHFSRIPVVSPREFFERYLNVRK